MIKHPSLVGEPGGGPRIAGTKAPSRLDRFESFLVTTVETQRNTQIKMTEGEVRVQLDRAARMRYGGPGVAGPKACLGENILGLWIFTIERHSLKGGFPSLTHEWSEVLDRAVVPLHNQRTGKPQMGIREIGIERKRLLEKAVGRDALGAGALVHMPEAALAIIPGAHVLRPFRDYALDFGAGQRWLDRCGDTRGDVVLHREDVSQIPVVTLGPEMGTGGCIDQLAADAHPLSGPAQATLEDIADTKVAADLLWVDGFSFIGECRIAGDDKKPAPFRQRCDDVLGNAVDKILLLGITTDIVKRKDGDRGPVGHRPWRRRPRQDRRSVGRRCEKSAIGPHRSGDVLDLLFAHVFERYS